MKRHLLLLPLIAVLSGLIHAEDAAKPVMNGMGGMDKMDMKSMNAKGDIKPGGDTKPGDDMKAMHDMREKCMGDNKAADNGKGMDDMKSMHDNCMQAQNAKKPGDKTVKKPRHHKTQKDKHKAVPVHDHNHGASAGQ
ncbi:MAG TPA: hypothetical protein VFW49_02445 [Fluviicoccus sp.]|nr:hypothetical protein [Fluviicoccus sp.]